MAGKVNKLELALTQWFQGINQQKKIDSLPQ
jgi:hypothetical protein